MRGSSVRLVSPRPNVAMLRVVIVGFGAVIGVVLLIRAF